MSGIVTVELIFEKETKNMVRYNAPGNEEQQRGATIPNVYVRKTALAGAFGKFPAKIKVMIETSE